MSLRDRNRRAAMRAVQAVAVRRFRDAGFDEVTVQDVAAEAEVSASTVYRYFGTKEELVLWDEHDAVVEAALGKHLGSVRPLAALAAAFVEAYSLSPEMAARVRERVELIDETPALLAFQVARLDKDRAELTRALIRVYGPKWDSLELDLAARIAISALLAAFEHWLAPRSRKSLPKWIAAAFDAARAAAND